MSTLKQVTEDTTDRQQSKKLAHLKCYSFLLFYSKSVIHSPLHKITFKIRDGSAQEGKGAEQEKHIQMSFYQLESQEQRIQGLLDLKATSLQSKSKVIGYCGEGQMLQLLQMAHQIGLDVSSVPVVLADSHPNSDLAIFSGWKDCPPLPFHLLTFQQLENLARGWMQAATQKIDIWTAKLTLAPEGRLQKLERGTYQPVEADKELQMLFMSHLSLGRHVAVSRRYQQQKGPTESMGKNEMVYRWQKMKSFCCLGPTNMLASTGVVNISFRDDRGREVEVLKHFRQYEGSEESEVETRKVIQSDRSIHTLLISNIDRFHGNKLQKLNCKPGDGRLEVALFEGSSSYRRLSSVGGELMVKLEGECLEMQVGQRVYRCWGASLLRLQQWSRARIAISRQALSC